MIFSWLARRRRAAIRAQPPADAWQEVTRTGLWQYARLPAEEQDRVRTDAAILAAEKNWEGLGGVQVTEAVKLTVAAQVALMTIGFPPLYFDRVPSILLEAGEYEAVDTTYTGGTMIRGRSSRLGEAHYRGPVKLSWPAVRRAGRSSNHGRHLVIHEFAHQLDTLNGVGADGNPVIESAAEADRWSDVCDRSFEKLCRACEEGGRPLMDCYGATDRAEFFAVASEVFFQTPRDLHLRDRDLFEVLQMFYRQDPLRWVPKT